MKKIKSFKLHFEKPVNEIHDYELWKILDKIREDNTAFKVTVSNVIPKEDV